MKYAGIIKNDVSAGEGVCVTLFTQGCPHKCPGCHNPETWSFDGGKDFSNEVLDDVLKSINANGVLRNFCLMGGEPLCQENLFLSLLVLKAVKEKYPNIKIYIWSGYTIEELMAKDGKAIQCLKLADYLIDGPFILAERDITLPMRGSRNQRIIDLKEWFKE